MEAGALDVGHGRVVFAAGRGERLRPHTDEIPKPLLEIVGEPLLARCLRAVVAAGVDRIGLADALQSLVDDGNGTSASNRRAGT